MYWKAFFPLSFKYLNLLHATVSFAVCVCFFFSPGTFKSLVVKSINGRFIFTLLYTPLDLSRDVVGRIMAPPKTSKSLSLNLRICYLTWPKGLCKCDYGKDPGWKNYPGFSR